MNCKQILHDGVHEAYLLNQLNSEEKEAYEHHLKECTTCREQLEINRELIEGIRESGKKKMRDEIALQVKLQKSRKQEINWPIILKAAATVFIIVTILSALYLFQIDTPEELNGGIKSQPEMKKGDAGDQTDIEDQQTGSSLAGETKTTTIHPGTKQTSPPTLQEKSDKMDQSDGTAITPANILMDKSSEILSAEEPTGTGASIDAGISSAPAPTISKEKGMNYEIYTFANQAVQYFSTARKESGQEYLNTVRPQTSEREIEKPLSRKKELSEDKNKAQIVNEQYAKLLFKSSKKQIEINLFHPQRQVAPDSLTGFSKEFAVNILRRNKDFWEMDWFVDINMFNFNASQIVIHKYGDEKIDVILPGHDNYHIDLTIKSPVAILKK